MRYLVDIGASQGLFANYVAKIYRNRSVDPIKVFAIEPIPEVAARINRRENIVIVSAAVLSKHHITHTGTVRLNVFRNHELSSILDINQNLDDRVWSNHLPGPEPVKVIEVPAITLEQLMNDYKIPHIDFLKIDTQGTDLSVLESAGRKIGAIKALVLEVPYSAASALYESETHLTIALDRVLSLGFSPVRIVPNGGGECNLFLRNQNLSVSDYFQIEKEMGLEKAPTLKIGPHDPYILEPWLARLSIKFMEGFQQLINHTYKICKILHLPSIKRK